MSPSADPYRTLGIVPGASLNEIRSAYRRLVKRYHPDAAGERALPRFLAIQAAYERLVDGEGRLRTASWAAGGTAPRRPEARRPQGSPEARSGGGPPPRPRGSGPERPGPKGSGPQRPGTGERRHGRPDGAPDDPGASRGGARPDPDSPRGGATRRPRAPRKATPGSTTYDEAAETPLDPPWDGGAWYGPSSGTFWTLNPREYADPRKHGPEYEARARRAVRRNGDGSSGPGP